MGKINVTSKNQSGGITAKNVSIYGDISNSKKKKKWKSIILIITILASITTIFAYFNVYPFEGTQKKDLPINSIKTNTNSPVTTNVEHKTINYFVTGTLNSKPKTQEKPKTESNMKKPKENNDEKDRVIVKSYNQTGGITANQVNIGAQQRILTEEMKKVLKEGVELRFLKNNFEKNTLISIIAPSDAEARNFGTQIKDYLTSEGFNVWQNLSTYMGNMGLNDLDVGFKADKDKKRLEIIINYKIR